MNLKVADIQKVMESWAPPAWAASWDRVGLQAGYPDQKVAGVAVCLTVTDAVIAQARTAGANLIIAHHPLIWDPIRTLRTDLPHIRRCIDLVTLDMACFVAHTNLDVAPGGVNDALAEILGFKGVKPLFPAEEAKQFKLVTFVPESHAHAVRTAVSEAGAGQIGEYTHCSFGALGIGTFLPSAAAIPFSGEKGQINEEPELRFETLTPKHRLGAVLKALFTTHPYDEVAYDVIPLENTDPRIGLGRVGELPEPMLPDTFAAQVQSALQTAAPRIIPLAKSRPIKKVAVLGGSGGGYITKLPYDIDAYVTGDVNYHQALDAQDRRLLVIDAGHHATETPVLGAVAAKLGAAFPGLAVHTCTDVDPFVER